MSNANVSWVMSPQSFRAYNRWHAGIGLLLALLLLLLPWMTDGRIGPHGWQACTVASEPSSTTATASPPPVASVPDASPAAATASAEPAAALPAAVMPAPAAAPSGTPPVVRVFFNVNKANLPDDVDETMNDVLAYLKAHPGAKAVVSGFHDEMGGADSQFNQILAQRRARAVADVLSGAGITMDRIVMSKPTVTAGRGNRAEARRVDVSVQP